MSNAVAETNAWIGGSCDVAVIRKIRRKFRIQSAEISEDKAYNLIVTELCLLKAGSGRVSFSHQVFRDYLSAVYLYACLRNNIRTERQWHEEKIHRGVVSYLRYMQKNRCGEKMELQTNIFPDIEKRKGLLRIILLPIL